MESNMAFEGLSERLQGALKRVGRKGKITESDLKEMMREVRLALLEADVNFKVVKEFVKKVQERATGSKVLEALSPAQQIVDIVNDELTQLMGGEQVPFVFDVKPPTVVMMVGLQGAGKTTTVGKIAQYVKKNHHKRPLLVAGDIYRPAAIEQLKTIGQQLDMPVFSLGDTVSPVEIAKQAIDKAVLDGRDLVLIDTAGRLHVNEELMVELEQIKQATNPTEILLVVDAMTGQDAVNVAEAFNERLDITGVVMTKLDGDTRGGAALSIRQMTGKPIKFTGQGEKLDNLEPFYPERMASRILGMGDMMTLIERAKQEFDEKEAAKMAEKLRENTFNFNDFIAQMDQMANMGPIEDLLKMIPGMSNMPGIDQVKIDPKDMAHMKAIVLSMTPSERENPDLLSQSRRKRIAKGSGQTLMQVNRMIKQFNESRKMMNQVAKGNMSGLENLMGGGVKGKLGKLAMKQMMKRAGKKMKKKKR